MTKEEAIKILNDYMGGKIDPESTELYQAIELAVDILESQHSLNLDEAVNGVMPISYGSLEVDCYGGSEPVYSREQMVEMFKAGAEWMAEQGYVTETTVDKTPFNGPTGICMNLHDSTGFKIGDKVIVQIRKKQ